VSFGTVFYQVAIGKIPWMIALPFVLNLVFNAAFAPLQFALRNNVLASIDIILLLITLIWAMIAIWPYLRWVTYASIPYVLWVSFATVLQLKLSYLNR
jgi:tryptophan-rich sensory protein